MAWVLNVCLAIVFLVCVLMSLASGLWGNLIMIFNVMVAALIATSYFEPLAGFLEEQMPSYKFFVDFLAMWAIFALSAIVLRTITDSLSQVKVRFKKPVEMGGGLFCGAVVGWLMVCFTLFSLHTAPLGQTFLGGGFVPGTDMFLGMAPDRQWGRFAQGQSNVESGPLTAGEQFNIQDYMEEYRQRRAAFEAEPGLRTRR
jgi:hypothetical protein